MAPEPLTDVLVALARANLAGGAAILVVLALRRPARRLFGAHVAYALWLAPLLATLASLLPPLTSTEQVADAGPWRNTPWLAAWLLTAWVLGAALSSALVALGQWRFLRRAREGRAGPAVVGILCPRVVVPKDFADLFTPQERALVKAHERAHLDRHDARVNALATLLQCLNWFNPLAHLAVHHLRLDQELACDATALAGRPTARRLYAETLLKTQLAATALPLGCYWPARSPHPLEARIAMLAARPLADARRDLGAAAAATLIALIGLAAWIAQPPARAAPPAARVVVLELSPTTADVVLPPGLEHF